ncbi:MAG TPA: DUF5615 family PIN-like protein [Methylomirabilota bacterium]|nr:DUF5615 family PIN-like protein [Methylomirabilota bacterium]
MKVKLDENLPAELLDDLNAIGYQAASVHQEGLTGAVDEILLRAVRHEGRAIFTMDKGVADVRAYPPEQHNGIVLFRPPSAGRGAVRAFVRRHASDLLARDLKGRLLVVTDRGIRIR